MKHYLKKIVAVFMALAMIAVPAGLVKSEAAGAASTEILGANAIAIAAEISGVSPIAAYDFSGGKRSDTSGRNLADVILGGNSSVQANGIKLDDGYFMLPENLFSDIPAEEIDGFTVSMTMTKAETIEDWKGIEWAEVLFSFSSVMDQATDSSFYCSYNGNVGTGNRPYSGDGNWTDGALGGLLPYDETHTLTVTYDVATNTVVLYVDDMLAASSAGTQWDAQAKLTVDDIRSFTANAVGRATAGNWGMWSHCTIEDLTIYSTALAGSEVRVLVNEGWQALKNYQPEEELSGNGDGTFTVAALNVDGLPQAIKITLLGVTVTSIDLNSDGPGSAGTTKISQSLAGTGWDIIGTSENFTYVTQLESALNSTYTQSVKNKETVPESVASTQINNVIKNLPFDTDGLTLFWKNSLKITETNPVPWEVNYATDKTYAGYTLPAGNGADTLITKGFRYFQAEIAEGVEVDVYILHMDAESDEGDKLAREAQMEQLVNYIKASGTKNPIVIMGDTNCRYTRDDVKSLLIDSINEDSRFTIQDAWVEDVWDGIYPYKGAGALMAADKTDSGKGFTYPQAEIVDKIFFINNADSDIYLRLDSYKVDESFTNTDGSPLADHWPVVAQFTYAKKHTVTYTDGTGSGTVFADQTYKDILTGNTTPEFTGEKQRVGYVFAGWTPEWSETVTDDVTYTAVWKPDVNDNGVDDDLDPKYTVTYTDNAAGEIFEDQVYSDILVGLPTPAFEGTVPARENYIFAGWDPEVASTVKGSVTYTAVWKEDFNHNGKDDAIEDHFTVTYKDNANQAVFEDQVYDNILIGLETPAFNAEKFDGGDPERRYYIFNGWNPQIAETVTGDVVYVAKWLADTNENGIPDEDEGRYTISYSDGFGGIYFDNQIHNGLLSGETTPAWEGADPTREDYIFGGWDPAVEPTVTKSIDYYAIWLPDFNHNGIDDATEEHFTVTYTDGVEDEEIFEDEVHSNILTGLDTPDFEGDEPIREGYVFSGWNPDIADKVTEDTTYTAIWKVDSNGNGIADEDETHTVTFVADGKTVATITKLDGETLSEEDYPEFPEKEGYIGRWETVTGPVTENLTIHAIYIPIGDTPGESEEPTTPGETEEPTTPGETEEPTTPCETEEPTTPGETDEPASSNKPATPTEPEEPTASDKPVSSIPTGDTAQISLYVIMLAMTAGALLMVRKRAER